MTGNKKEALAQFHRSNIIQAAERLFLEKGIENTTVDNIAKAADYSKATIYVYFKNKEEIISSITLVSMLLFHTVIQKAVSKSTNFVKQYNALCNALVEYQKDYPLYFDSLLKEINVDLELPETPKVYQEIYDVGEEINLEIGIMLQNGIEQGIVRREIDIPQTVYFFWSGISGLIRMATLKEKCFIKSIGITKVAFLQYSFETLLRSITNNKE